MLSAYAGATAAARMLALVTTASWLARSTLAVAALPQQQQVIFSAPSISSAGQGKDFSLVHAVHLGSHSHPGLIAHHRFNPSDPVSYTSLQAGPSTFSASDSLVELEDQNAPFYPLEQLHVKSTRQRIWKPSHSARSPIYEAARLAQTARYARDGKINALADQLTWEQVEADVPDIGDVETLSTLAKMSSNAYSTPKDDGWYDLHTNDTSRPSYNLSSSFGWAEDGIRGHVFSSGPANESIVVAIKGTSAFIGGGTGRNDKFNDNLLFSCCCARVDWTWTPVCDCYSGVGESGDSRCNQTCLEDAMIEKSLYYPSATDLFNNITEMYPTSNVWLTGHSLGGSMAALLGATFGIPTVTFEAPGDLLAAKRLHLPLPPGADWHNNRPEFGITHVYTNSDPIPQGVVSYPSRNFEQKLTILPQCTGYSSTCNFVGFALESKCHTGQSVIYDAVGKLGWTVDVRTHRIGTLIEKLLIADWAKDEAEIALIPVTSEDALLEDKASSRDWLSAWGWPWPGRRKRRDDENEPDKPGDEGPTSSTTGSSTTPLPTATPPPARKKSHVPKPEIDDKCRDCFKWEFFDDYDGMPGKGKKGNKTKGGQDEGQPADPPDPWATVFSRLSTVTQWRRYRAFGN